MHSFLLAPSIQYFIVALTSVFFLVDPFAALPTFLVIAADADQLERRRLARKSSITCFVVLTAFASAGSVGRELDLSLLRHYVAGIRDRWRNHPHPDGIGDASGAPLGYARNSGRYAGGSDKGRCGIIPLGTPMLAGPGAISSVMVLTGPSPSWWRVAIVFIAITITVLASFMILSAADRVRHFLGETGIRILTRLMGLLLTAIAVQFIVNGLAELGVVSPAIIPKRDWDFEIAMSRRPASVSASPRLRGDRTHVVSLPQR